MVRIFDTRLQLGNDSAAHGEVTNIGTEEISVALAGGTLIVKRMRGEGGKIAAKEFAKQVDLKVGDLLG
jgi:hypothetical protein